MSAHADRLLGTDDVAAQLKCSPWAVRDYAKAGDLRGSKPGKRWLFEQADVDAFVRAAENRPRETPRRRRRRVA
jgi:excisionase family DNA binding protein